MNINSVSPYQSVSNTKNTDTKTDSTTANVFSISQTTENVQEANSSNIWEELSSKYDIRKATFEEVKEISLALYKDGKISVGEHLLLTFDKDAANKEIMKQLGITPSPNYTTYETPANSNGERDWIVELEARAKNHFKYGDLLGYQNYMKILTNLQRLDT